MKVIIAGCRDFDDYDVVCGAIERSGFEVTEVVWGCARGVDTLGKRWADAHGVPHKPFPADWSRWGNDAGKRRNTQMAEYGEALVAVWDGLSTGTKNMIKQMRFRGKPCYVCRV